MVNRVVPRGDLATATFALAEQIATMPAFGLVLAKRAVNQCEDQMGMRAGMDSVFGLHHLAHAHNAETAGDSLAGHGRPEHEAGGRMSLDRGLPGGGAGLAGRARAGRAAAVSGHGRGVRAAPRLGAGAAAARLAVVSWPAEYGGRDLPLLDWLVFEEEYHAAGGPVRVGQNGLFLLAPTLFAHGTAEQRDRLLPRWPGPTTSGRRPGRSRRRAATWPRSGPARTAVRPEGWLLTGSKTWSSRAAFADKAFGLFRSEPGRGAASRADLPDVRPAGRRA